VPRPRQAPSRTSDRRPAEAWNSRVPLPFEDFARIELEIVKSLVAKIRSWT
jgi:hypothetical protein